LREEEKREDAEKDENSHGADGWHFEFPVKGKD
jgi:hypothetical protein